MLDASSGLRAGGAFVRAADGPVWGAEVRVDDAWRIRLHLSDVELPRDARMWVYDESGHAAGPFGAELIDPEGSLWTPSVHGPVLRFEVEIPAQDLESNRTYGFRVDRVLERVRLDSAGSPVWPTAAKVATACIRDGSCFDSSDWQVIDPVRKSIAQLSFVKDGVSYSCTGGLLNDTDESTEIPYLLTSSDCFDTQQSASSLEATWDWHTTSCNGPAPGIDSRPKSFGATLLATGKSSDFTLVRLNTIPPGRVFLGWNADREIIGPDSKLHRLSHPAPNGDPFPQSYSRSTGLLSEFNHCGPEDGRPLDDPTKFLHHDEDIGGTFEGSFGAPLIKEGPEGWVVGQLWCHCGSAPHEGCDKSANDTLDGAFSNTYGHIAQYVDPAAENAPPPYSTWLRSQNLPGFEAQVRITPASGGERTQGSLEGNCIAETLCASGALAGRPEIFVKVIGPRPNGFLWVQLIRFTPSQVEVWLRQISTGAVNFYRADSVEPGAGVLSGLEDRRAYEP